jgi:tRNA A58 N-methylase Trm61
MLMPNKDKALEVARKILKPGGKIYAFLTLYENKNRFIEWIKPKIVKFTSIEFGPVMYRKQVSFAT